MLKKWVKRIFIIVLVLIVTILVLTALFFACVEKVKLSTNAWKTATEEYSDWYLLEYSREHYIGFIKMPGNLVTKEWLFILKGERDSFIEKVLDDIREDVAVLPEECSSIQKISFEEDTGKLKIYITDNRNMREEIYAPEGIRVFDKIVKLEERCELLYELRNPDTKDGFDRWGEDVEKIVLNQDSFNQEEVGEDVFNKQDVNCLKEIISRSKNKNSFNFHDERKIRGTSTCSGGGNIWYLDLSDYSDITGELDLSGFANLRRIALRGMKINSVILPDSLTSIEPDTFDDCKELTEITIPQSVTSFSNPVFSGCKNLKEIVFEGNAPKISWEREDIFGKVPDDLIIYRRKSAKGWQEIVWDKYDVRVIE